MLYIKKSNSWTMDVIANNQVNFEVTYIGRS